MGGFKKYWLAVVAVLVVGFSVLGYLGTDVYHNAPPVPKAFVTADGKVLFTEEDILHGQTAWQTTGGQEVGTVLGHGGYQAPDWTADWLHREVVRWLDITAERTYGAPYDALTEPQQAQLRAAAHEEYRQSQVREDGTVVLSDTRVQAMREVAPFYIDIYGGDPAYQETRDHFAMKTGTLPLEKDRIDLARFFFWTTWMSAAQRPGSDSTYTNNWPHEPLLDNVPSAEATFWSMASIIFLLIGVGALIWVWSFAKKEDGKLTIPTEDPISKMDLTPSQRALGKYLVVIASLFFVQVSCGGLLAHYTIEGGGFYGIPLGEWLPYSVVRTWHLQASLFWIAISFLAGGLFLAPIINGGEDPSHQKLGVNVLFVALLILAGGTFAGTYLAIAHVIPEELSFFLGHQGYEYLDLGRIWQIIEFVGILFWLFLMIRSVVLAFKHKGDKNLIAAFLFSVIMVGLFYGPGLFYGEHTSLTIMEYWRWWVVHLWVEGFFEVFSVCVLSFLFVKLGLVSYRSGTVAALSAGAIYLIGGIPGTFHHLYFSGVTTAVMATGASFSALEVVPLILLGYEAFEHYSHLEQASWMRRMKWPVYCFMAVSFWNLVGAGILGFLINMPVSLFYIQGLNTTPVHAHAALFGVYGFLSIGFVLMVIHYIRPEAEFSEWLMKVTFWGLNLGLALMILLSMLPIGIIQAWGSLSTGLWYARSEAFMQMDVLQDLRWARLIGDSIFMLGALTFLIQVVHSVSRCRRFK